MKFVEAHLDKDWDWVGISQNPNLTMEFINSRSESANPDKPWNWMYISSNPNITMDFIERNINKIDWINLSRNKFGWKQENTQHYYKQRKTQTIEKTKHIKEELIAETWHPDRFIRWCVDNEELKEIEETFGK